MNKSDLKECFQLVSKDFSLDTKEDTYPVDSEELRDRVRQIVQILLDENLEKLLLVLYRIDVNEQKVKEVLACEEPNKLADTLADLIILREVEKVVTRRKYSQ